MPTREKGSGRDTFPITAGRIGTGRLDVHDWFWFYERILRWAFYQFIIVGFGEKGYARACAGLRLAKFNLVDNE